jgi:hypothetical protein
VRFGYCTWLKTTFNQRNLTFSKRLHTTCRRAIAGIAGAGRGNFRFRTRAKALGGAYSRPWSMSIAETPLAPDLAGVELPEPSL